MPQKLLRQDQVPGLPPQVVCGAMPELVDLHRVRHIGIAILRYRLYQIDKLISRTITYALVTATLGGVFVGGVVLLTDVLPFSSPVAVAASTLAAAALFTPLRLRIQLLIDHRFNRTRYDAEAILAAFTRSLRNEVELDAICEQLIDTARDAVAPAHASIWTRPST
jgi:hypothetical protein